MRMALQLAFALVILKLQVGGRRPDYALFGAVVAGVKQSLDFTDAGSSFVFGLLANEPNIGEVV
jgi:nucleoside permease NupC